MEAPRAGGDGKSGGAEQAERQDRAADEPGRQPPIVGAEQHQAGEGATDETDRDEVARLSFAARLLDQCAKQLDGAHVARARQRPERKADGAQQPEPGR